MMDRLSDHISETSHKDVLIEDQLKELRGVWTASCHIRRRKQCEGC